MKTEITLFYRSNTDRGICIPLGDLSYLVNEFMEYYPAFLKDLPAVGGASWYMEQTEEAIEHIWKTVAPKYNGKQPPFGQNIALDLQDPRIRQELVIVMMNIVFLTKCGALQQDDNNGLLVCQSEVN